MAEAIIPTKIILADDDRDDVLLFCNAMTDLQLAVHLTQVHDGEQLLHELNRMEVHPDIIFMDSNMPRKNGLTCLRAIKQSLMHQPVPVVILSTSNELSVVSDFYNAGAQYYICKPADYRQLKACIKNAFRLLIQHNLQQPSRNEFELLWNA